MYVFCFFSVFFCSSHLVFHQIYVNDCCLSDLRASMVYELTSDKVHIDGSCGPKTLAGALLVRFERVSHVTHFHK